MLEKDVFRSRDLFKFWKISDDISETMQDLDIVAMEDYQMASLLVTLRMTFKVTCAV